MQHQKVYHKHGDIVTRRLLDETILVPIKGDIATMNQIFSLNPVAEHIWEQLDGQTSLDHICDNLVETFDISRQQAETDLFEFIEALDANGLIAEN